MVATVKSSCIIGYEAKIIDVETDTSNSLPGIVIVGLGTKSIDESKERIRSAIKNSQLSNPKKRITINLSPANLPKDGSHFDLPLSLSILLQSEQIPADCLRNSLAVGELGLDGDIKPIQGVIGHVIGARKAGIRRAFIPYDNYQEASLISGIELVPIRNLRQIVDHLTDTVRIKPPDPSDSPEASNPASCPDLSEVVGNQFAKKALEIAAAGWHNIMLSGPPGGGKTMLASCLPGILPPLNEEQMIETSYIHSLHNESGAKSQVMLSPPFRAPHHTASTTSLVGGGQHPKPGEVSLAHNGVLFLDEIPEFNRSCLEALRQPLEADSIQIARASSSVHFPARFMLVATRNPCPCGNYGDQQLECNCLQASIDKYQQKLSGPLLDRIDIQINVGRTRHELLLKGGGKTEESSTSVRSRVIHAQKIQHNRQGRLNSRLTKSEIQTIAKVAPESLTYLNRIAEQLNISPRSYIKILRTARTIADLRSENSVQKHDIVTALQLRI